MQASALPTPAPDLFEAPAMRLEFIGTLISDAQVRAKPVGDGTHIAPVLCLALAHVGHADHTLNAEQIFSNATRSQAEALAKTLKKGAQVRLTTSLLDMRIFLPHVEQVQLAQ